MSDRVAAIYWAAHRTTHTLSIDHRILAGHPARSAMIS
jgi:hypothetical protein